MPIPGLGQEKRLGKIRQELESQGYTTGPFTAAPTSLNDAENGEYDVLNSAANDNFPSSVNPAKISEWDNYDHTLTLDVYGCMDDGSFGVTINNLAANNYNPDANQPADCEYTWGCTNPSSFNYNSSATADNGGCVAFINGCTNPSADNYNSSANTDDGSCYQNFYECADPLADNYSTYAIVQDNLQQDYEQFGLIQELYGCPECCEYSVDGDYDDNGEVDAFTELETSLANSVNSPVVGCATSIIVKGHENSNMQVGLDAGFRLSEVVYGGGPANDDADYYDNTYGTRFVQWVLLYSLGNDDTGSSIGSWNLNNDSNIGNEDTGKILLYNGLTQSVLNGGEGGYVNADGSVNTWAMAQDHGGGPIYLSIKMGKFRAYINENNPNLPGGGLTQADAGVGYFKQAYLKITFQDINVQESFGGCYPDCDDTGGDSVSIEGCADMQNDGDCSVADPDYVGYGNSNCMHCVTSEKMLFGVIRQGFCLLVQPEDNDDDDDEPQYDQYGNLIIGEAAGGGK